MSQTSRTPKFVRRIWNTSAWRITNLVILILLLLASAFQFGVLYTDFIVPRMRTAWTYRDLPMWERAGLFLEGPDFAGYIEFIRNNVPENAKVILPPSSMYTPYAHVGLMQFFLFPRDLHNCGADEVEECVKRVQGSDWYILAVQRFPPEDIASQSMRRIDFNSKLGLYVPESD